MPKFPPRFVRLTRSGNRYAVQIGIGGRTASFSSVTAREAAEQRDSALYHVLGIRDPNRFSLGPYTDSSPPILSWARELLSQTRP